MWEAADGEGAAADEQQADEGGSVWEEDDPDCTWAVDDEEDDVVYAVSGRLFFKAEVEESESEEEEEDEGLKDVSLTPTASSQNIYIYMTRSLPETHLMPSLVTARLLRRPQ